MATTHSGAGLLHRLLGIEDGLKKHASDPTFPNLSYIGDIGAEHDILSNALTKANASRATWRADAGAARAEMTRTEVLLQKYVKAIQSWAGTRSDLLKDFGLTPHKMPRKRGPRTAHTGSTGHGRSHTGAAHGAAASEGDSASPTPTESTSGGK